MGRFFLLFILVLAGFFNICSREKENKNNILAGNGNPATTTTVYLVRHAEKEISNPNDQDPDLTSVGLKRAEDLKAYLEDVSFDAFFSTPYKRNQKTISPLAQGRPIQFYEAHDFTKLRDRILTDFKGKTVLVVAHSNTVLPIIEAFGARKPFDEIGDNEYDNIFKLRVSGKGKATVQAKKFGVISTHPTRL